MKKWLLLAALTGSVSGQCSEALNLHIKIHQGIGEKKSETIKTISARFNEDVVIGHHGSGNKIIVNLKKVDQINVNGNQLKPVQIEMMLVNDLKGIVGKPQTVTSFYRQTAQFALPSVSTIPDGSSLNVFLNFKEVN